MKFGTMRTVQVKSPLAQMAQVRPQSSGRSLTSVVAPLMLTSLVDAFAVIVIYLLVSTTQGKKDLDIENQIQLPTAQKTEMIQPGVSLKIVDGKYFLGEESLKLPQLLEELTKMSALFKETSDPRAGSLVIQADKDSDYKTISPILSVASQSGFEKIKFATLEQ